MSFFRRRPVEHVIDLRFPARDSRWRMCWPLEASIGAVPFQDAKWSRLGEPGYFSHVGQDPGRASRADAFRGCRAQQCARPTRPLRAAAEDALAALCICEHLR
jgi:hypothetical protein